MGNVKEESKCQLSFITAGETPITAVAPSSAALVHAITPEDRPVAAARDAERVVWAHGRRPLSLNQMKVLYK